MKLNRTGRRFLLLVGSGLLFSVPQPAAGQITELTVSSPAFVEGGAIPLEYTAYGENRSPAISWEGAPAETRSFALIMHDRSAPMPGGFVHWVVYNIPGAAEGLPEALPAELVLEAPPELAGTTRGLSDMRNFTYYGPRPQPGDAPHHYIFTVYALDRTPDLEPGLDRNAVLSRIRDQVIGQGILTGVFARN